MNNFLLSTRKGIFKKFINIIPYITINWGHRNDCFEKQSFLGLPKYRGDILIELGGNITLSGFSDLDHMELTVAKKIIGRYAREMSDDNADFENLIVTLKDVHKTATNQKYEIHGKLMLGGKPLTSEVTDRNLFVALDSSMKKIIAESNKKAKK